MNKSLLDNTTLTRWRHSRGFGVHSPFAYRIITDAIRLKDEYAYYGYSEICRVCRKSRNLKAEKDARLLLRLSAILGIHSTFISKKAPEPFHAALKGAYSGMRICHNANLMKDCDLVAADANGGVTLKSLTEFISTPVKTLMIRNCPPDWRTTLFDAMQEGLMLEGRSNIILFSRPQMQKLSYLSSI